MSHQVDSAACWFILFVPRQATQSNSRSHGAVILALIVLTPRGLRGVLCFSNANTSKYTLRCNNWLQILSHKMSLRVVFSNILNATKPQIISRPTTIRWLTQEQVDKGFVDGPTPYQKPKEKCILCRHNIQLDYKNPRLLSQFVSSLNGVVYDKHITGLCEKQQTILEREIKKSRRAMLMPIYYKHPKYNRDPALFNPEKPQRSNPYWAGGSEL